MTTLEKLHYIQEKSCIYNICYRRAGVAFQFYEHKKDNGYIGKGLSEDWRDGLVIYHYYETFERAIDKEYERLSNE